MRAKTTCLLAACLVGHAAVAAAYERTQALAFSPDGKLLAVGGVEKKHLKESTGYEWDQEFPVLHIWDLQSGKVVRTIAPDNKAFDHFWHHLEFSPDGKRLLAAGAVWDVATGKIDRRIKGLAWSPDGKWVTDGVADGSGSGGIVWVRDANTGAERFARKDIRVDDLAFSPDSTRIAVSEGTHIHIVKASTGEDVFFGNNDGGFPVVWTDDGAYVIMAGLVVDPATGKVLAESNSAETEATVVTHDGKWVGRGGKDGLSWMKTSDMKTQYTWTGEVVDISAMAYSKDGNLIAVGHPGSPAVQIIDPNKNSLHVLQTLSAPPAEVRGDPDPYGKSEGYVAEVKAEPRPQPRVEPEKAAPKELKGEQKEAMSKLEQAASYAAVWLGKLNHPEDYKDELAKPSFMKLAVDQGKECAAAVAAARKAGLGDDAPVDFNVYESGLAKPMPIGELEAKLCQPLLGAAGARVEAQASAAAAAVAPYLKVLSGDKAKIFQDQHMIDGVSCAGRCSGMYGRGMKRLKTPADFEASDVWYYYVHVQDAAVETWEVEGWKFSGMKKTGTYDRRGHGDVPPASAFE
jgi:hypothetical protein